MKTQTLTQKKTIKILGFFALCMILTLVSNPLAAQTERTVKGTITDEVGPVELATVILKGTTIYVDTDENGAFTFPQKLKENDILVINRMGYKNKEVSIGPNTTFLNIAMDDYAIIVVGALMLGDNAVPEDQNN